MSDSAPGPTMDIEHSLFAGGTISSILYGILVYMVFQTWYLMRTLKTETPRKKTFYICYGFVQLFLLTVELGTHQFVGEKMWIDHRGDPGGPFAWYLSISNSWYSVWDVVCGVISNAMNDGLLLYRCYIIWNGNKAIMVLPILIFLGEIAMGILVPIESAIPNVTFFAKQSTSFSIPWISLACALNAILTLLIITRILWVTHGWKSPSSSRYIGAIAILAESAAILSISGIIFVVCVGRNLLPSFILADIYGCLVAIAPQTIILRVAMGRAWAENRTLEDFTVDINFADKSTISATTRSGNVSDTVVHVV